MCLFSAYQSFVSFVASKLIMIILEATRDTSGEKDFTSSNDFYLPLRCLEGGGRSAPCGPEKQCSDDSNNYVPQWCSKAELSKV
jgi:hypothetical protein